MQSKLPIAVLCGVLLMTLAACGGSGDGARITELEADLVAEQEARELAEEQAADAEEKLEQEQAAREAAEAAAEAAEAEAAEAEAAKEAAAEAEAALQAAEEAEQQAQQQLQQAQQESQQLEQQLTEAEQAELRARSMQFLTAITDGGSERAGVSVTYERGSTLKINPGGNFETGSGAPAISGFTPRTYTRQVGITAEQTLYHYTNIQAPGTRAFWKIHGLEVADAHGNAAQNPTPTGTARVVTVGSSRDYADDATYDIAVSGTYDGVSGTYTCTTGCTIDDRDDDEDQVITAADFDADDWVTLTQGVRSFATGNAWTFKPGSNTSGVQQMSDTEYLYFGIWVQEPNLISGTYGYQWFTGGSALFTDVTNTSLPGTAKTAYAHGSGREGRLPHVEIEAWVLND